MKLGYNIASFLLSHSKMSEFQKKVLLEISKTHLGETLTYAELAGRIGTPKSARAVGNALHNNPYPVIIPCHRVVAHNGIGGYGSGVPVKKVLLGVESIFKSTG